MIFISAHHYYSYLKVCTDFDYTECSCYISRLLPVKQKSHKILIGFIGVILGFFITIVSYMLWAILNSETNNVVRPDESNEELSEIDLNSTLSSYSEDSYQRPDTLRSCNCFVDHNGYDHFQRFDEKLRYKYKFHYCKHKDARSQLFSSSTKRSKTSSYR